MVNFVQEKKIVNLDYIHPENIYSHDAFFFKEIEPNESWDFQSQPDISLTSLGFLFIRSLLFQELQKTKLPVSNLSQSMKIQLAKDGYANYFNQFFETNPIPSILTEQKTPELISDLFLENKSFHMKDKEKNADLLLGGGILKENKTNAHALIEKLFSYFDLSNVYGHLFLRTKSSSYLYLLNPENKSKTFYIQQKNLFSIDFQFYHIKISK
ncbi:MAG TPA: hypothetical protein PLS71_17800 [Leptospiraceae bacterium]|nr:hypothetical protein [Leptospiraceae bacterium]HNE08985.1 hypothetical protein [Leptospiraceae bacterium]HNH01806.1 hypothetical protein [Leptospiraceae bacterium]HNI87679.1 hypothetical protein [Leptospiraceae bacterium]HNK58078.1 hypothetical protein [Leptospiraceae bacterium]